MFEAAQLGRKLSKDEFKELEPALHTRLLEVQRLLRDSNRSVVLVVSGVEGAGKGAQATRHTASVVPLHTAKASQTGLSDTPIMPNRAPSIR